MRMMWMCCVALAASLLILSGCTIDVPWVDGVPDGTLNGEPADVKLVASPDFGHAPLQVVFYVDAPDVIAPREYEIVVASYDGVFLHVAHGVVATYTFHDSGLYRAVLKRNDAEVAATWVLIQRDDEPLVVWETGKYLAVGLAAPTEVKVGRTFAIRVYLRVLRDGLEFYYGRVVAHHGGLQFDDDIEFMANWPRPGIYEYTFTGAAFVEQEGRIVVEAQGGPPRENQKVVLEINVKVTK